MEALLLGPGETGEAKAAKAQADGGSSGSPGLSKVARPHRPLGAFRLGATARLKRFLGEVGTSEFCDVGME